jgi:hydroxylamine reductase (hybrid-cluster protein)
LGTVKIFTSFSPPIVKLRPCFERFEPSDVYGAVPSATAKNLKGFWRILEPADYHTAGFNHRAVLPLLAGQGIKAVQSGALSRIALIRGCDEWDKK